MKSRAERKAKLRGMAEEEIEQLLDWMEATDRAWLGGIEEAVLRIGKRSGERMTGEVSANQEARRAVPCRRCATCQKEMHDKGMKPKAMRMNIFSSASERSNGIMALNIYIGRHGSSFRPRLPPRCAGSITPNRGSFTAKPRRSQLRWRLKSLATGPR